MVSLKKMYIFPPYDDASELHVLFYKHSFMHHIRTIYFGALDNEQIFLLYAIEEISPSQENS